MRPAQQARLESYEDCTAALTSLYQAALSAEGPDGFMQFLESARRFSHLSVFNAMMVRVQRPGAEMVASRKQWQRLNRFPAPDAIPIIVLQPFGPIMFLYDVDDTIGEPIEIGAHNPFTARGAATEHDLNRIVKAAREDQIMVETTLSYGASLAGTAARLDGPDDPIEADQPRWRIRVNARQSIPVQLSTLGHEIGHIYCGHLGGAMDGAWPNRGGLPYELQEIEAESVAWIICQRRGVEPNSAEYLRSLIAEADLSLVGIWAVFAAANRSERYATRS